MCMMHFMCLAKEGTPTHVVWLGDHIKQNQQRDAVQW